MSEICNDLILAQRCRKGAVHPNRCRRWRATNALGQPVSGVRTGDEHALFGQLSRDRRRLADTADHLPPTGRCEPPDGLALMDEAVTEEVADGAVLDRARRIGGGHRVEVAKAALALALGDGAQRVHGCHKLARPLSAPGLPPGREASRGSALRLAFSPGEIEDFPREFTGDGHQRETGRDAMACPSFDGMPARSLPVMSRIQRRALFSTAAGSSARPAIKAGPAVP